MPMMFKVLNMNGVEFNVDKPLSKEAIKYLKENGQQLRKENGFYVLEDLQKENILYIPTDGSMKTSADIKVVVRDRGRLTEVYVNGQFTMDWANEYPEDPFRGDIPYPEYLAAKKGQNIAKEPSLALIKKKTDSDFKEQKEQKEPKADLSVRSDRMPSVSKVSMFYSASTTYGIAESKRPDTNSMQSDKDDKKETSALLPRATTDSGSKEAAESTSLWSCLSSCSIQ